MESVLQKARVHCNGTIFQESVQLLAFADDINIIRRSIREETADFSAIERKKLTKHKSTHVIYFSTAFNSLIRDRIFEAMSKLGIAAKLIWLSRNRSCRRDETAGFSAIEWRSMGLTVNEGKTKYIVTNDLFSFNIKNIKQKLKQQLQRAQQHR